MKETSVFFLENTASFSRTFIHMLLSGREIQVLWKDKNTGNFSLLSLWKIFVVCLAFVATSLRRGSFDHGVLRKCAHEIVDEMDELTLTLNGKQ